MPGRHRPFAVQVLVNAAEREELQRAAEQNAMSVSSYTRNRLLAVARREAREAREAQQIERNLGILETEET